MKFHFVAFLVLALASCHGKKEKLFNESAIPTQLVTINIDRDTTFKTPNGALIQIPKGALTNSKGNSVQLEIKEAYSMQQMLEAGLVTQSNGEALSSGGMIYINAAAGQTVTITKAIRIALPADHLQDGMQLYKGNKTEDGNINWTDPKPLPENEQLKAVQTGQALFQDNCSSCHGIGKAGTGPDLAHFVKRFPLSNEGAWYLYEHGRGDIPFHEDLYFCNLYKYYNGTPGLTFKNLTSADLLPIYQFIQDESDRRRLPLPEHAYLKSCVDSCNLYNSAIRKLKEKESALIADNGDRTKVNWRDTITIDTAAFEDMPVDTTPRPPINFDNNVSPENFDTRYYEFNIDAFGWYNVDILLKGLPGVESSSLFVRLQGAYRERVTVHLIIPSVKALVDGGPAEQPGEYAFFKTDGSIPLPQREKAYIVAYADNDSTMAYATQEFVVSRQQKIDIKLVAATKEKFNQAIEQLHLDGISIKAAASKNADELKTMATSIKEAEKLKPSRCDCECTLTSPPKANNK